MKIDTNTPVADLCCLLRILSDTVSMLPEDSAVLIECADRLELLAGENEDLRNQNHYNRVAAEVRLGMIQQLKDHIQYWYGITQKDLKAMSDKGQWLANPQAKLIRELQDRIKRLEEAGDAMFIRSTRVGREIWTKAKEAKP